MDINDIKNHSYYDGTIDSFSFFGFKGEFPEDETERSGLVGFSFYFEPLIHHFLPERIYECKFCDIIDFDIQPGEKGYDLKLAAHGVFEDMSKEFFCIEFHCDYVSCDLYRYFGKSYKNIFSEDSAREAEQFISDEYFKEEKAYELADGYSLLCKKYAVEVNRGDNKPAACWSYGKYFLKRNSETIYEFICTDDHFGGYGFDIFEHSNGHRYFWFHTDLYGISYLDLDTMRVFNYIPEGFEHDYRQRQGESLIITDVHYDKSTGSHSRK